jgi:hypothetical protein
MRKQAIVTLTIGSAYAERFEQLCRANGSAYAERHGFDLVVIKEPLDSSERAYEDRGLNYEMRFLSLSRIGSIRDSCASLVAIPASQHRKQACDGTG